MGSCQRALPATPRRLLACLATYFLVPARAGTTSTCSARRLEPEGGGQYQGVFVALKPLPALEPHPILSRQPPLSPGQERFFKDYTGVPARVSGSTWARGGGGLGDGSGP